VPSDRVQSKTTIKNILTGDIILIPIRTIHKMREDGLLRETSGSEDATEESEIQLFPLPLNCRTKEDDM